MRGRIGLKARFEHPYIEVVGQADAMGQHQGHGLGVDAQGGVWRMVLRDECLDTLQMWAAFELMAIS